MAIFREAASHSVDHTFVFSLYFDYLYISYLPFWIWVLIASIPDLCILFTLQSFNVVDLHVSWIIYKSWSIVNFINYKEVPCSQPKLRMLRVFHILNKNKTHVVFCVCFMFERGSLLIR